ncbi:MAG: flagellar hook-basal body complex protein [Clostridiaceae bacterium]|nr:flagellar hook-basal body complex protein [Clostridiaceae bacterium]
MFRTMCTSKTGMIAQQVKLDTISANLSNSTTTGYKSVGVGFTDLLQYSLDRDSIPLRDKQSGMGTGVKATNYYRDNGQGPLVASGLTTDLALDGRGYFRVILPNGTAAYTRDGAFKIDSAGNIVDSNGNRLELNFVNGFSEDNFAFKSDNISIGTDGSVYAADADGRVFKVAEIPVYSAIGDDAFVALGDNLYVPNAGTNVERIGTTKVYQGYLEGSNVDMTTEMTNMIVTQRAFQLASKGVTTADEMWGMINNMR